MLRQFVPQWLARPASAASTLAALAGSGFIFWAAVTGAYWWAVWGVITFVAAGLLWHLADYADAAPPSASRAPGSP